MTKPTRATPALVVALAAATITVLAGCGGGTQTVSASSEPQAATEANGTTGGTGTKPSTTTTKTPATVPSAGTSTPATTRTAPEPAFAEASKGSGGSSSGGGSGALTAAETTVRDQGYTVDDQSDYKPDQTLRVLIGTGERSNDGYDKRAFFFVDNKYIGTDAGAPSAQISVAAQNDTEVVLAYTLYKPGNPLCCPAGGQAKVRFQLNNGQLTPLDPIPPANSTTGTSRQ